MTQTLREFAPVRRVGTAVALAIALLVPAVTPVANADTANVVRPAASGQKFSFGLWGDMPYARNNDAKKMPAIVADINRASIAFSVFDGDIKDGSTLCTPDYYAGASEMFSSIVTPVIYVPGDNEWTDCHRLNNGGYDNLERLDYVRKTMFASPNSFGQTQLALEHQGPLGGKYAENTRWMYGDVAFVGLNVPGSNNNKVNSDKECTDKSARTPAMCAANNAEFADRDKQNIAWLRQTFDTAKAKGMKGVVVVIQGDPGFDLPETESVSERETPDVHGLPPNDGYTNFLNVLVDETLYFPGQVILVHGDTHFFKMDKPLMADGKLLQNFTRIETFGSPNIHWVKVDVDPMSKAVFTITPMFVPGN
jgi:hypothetical protein